MSTHPQSGGPEGSPGYAQPQDPWAGGFEPGQASVPTDPIPHQYDPYSSYQQGDPWAQQTMPHGGYPGYPPPRRSRALPIAITAVIVLLLGTGAGYAAWYVATNNQPSSAPTTPAVQATSPGGQATSPGGLSTSPAVKFDAHKVVAGDCLINKGSGDNPDMQVVACNTAKSYKVIKVQQGTGIPEGPDGKFDRDTTSVAVCKDTDYESWYAYDDEDNDANDVFFCMTNNP
ncbi:MAG: hypothetical protein ACM30G_02895 [Micromonosporaceae bacterium]